MFMREMNVTKNRKEYYPSQHFQYKNIFMTSVGSFEKHENKSF